MRRCNRSYSDRLRLTSKGGVLHEKTCWLRHGISDGVTRDSLSSGTHMLHSKPDEEQQATCHQEEERDSESASRPALSDLKRDPGGESIREGIVHAANTYTAITQAAQTTLLANIEDESVLIRMSVLNTDDRDGGIVVPSHILSKMHHGQVKSPTRSIVQARHSAAVVVPPARRLNASVNPPISYLWNRIDVTLCPSSSAEVRFSSTGNAVIFVDGFLFADSSQGNSEVSSDPRYCEPLGATSRVEDLAFVESGSLG